MNPQGTSSLEAQSCTTPPCLTKLDIRVGVLEPFIGSQAERKGHSNQHLYAVVSVHMQATQANKGAFMTPR